MKSRLTPLILSASGFILAAVGFMTIDQPVAGGSAAHLPAQPFTDQACLDCHTDDTRLQTLAVAKEVAETPSEGPG